MKKFLVFFSLMATICASAQIEKVIPRRPSPPRLVNDFTNSLTPEQTEALEQKLVQYDDSTSNQVAVVIAVHCTMERCQLLLIICLVAKADQIYCYIVLLELLTGKKAVDNESNLHQLVHESLQNYRYSFVCMVLNY